MSKFFALYLAPAASIHQMMTNATPEQQKAGMDAWMAWAKKAEKSIVDLGKPLGNAQAVDKSGATGKGTTTVAGYSVMQAESVAELSKVLAGHPHFMMPGGTIEVLEAFDIM